MVLHLCCILKTLISVEEHQRCLLWVEQCPVKRMMQTSRDFCVHRLVHMIQKTSRLFLWPLDRLIGSPMLWLQLIGSHKTKRFISLVQALLLGKVVNWSDKGVTWLNFIGVFFAIEEWQFCPGRQIIPTEKMIKMSNIFLLLCSQYFMWCMAYTWHV